MLAIRCYDRFTGRRYWNAEAHRRGVYNTLFITKGGFLHNRFYHMYGHSTVTAQLQHSHSTVTAQSRSSSSRAAPSTMVLPQAQFGQLFLDMSSPRACHRVRGSRRAGVPAFFESFFESFWDINAWFPVCPVQPFDCGRRYFAAELAGARVRDFLACTVVFHNFGPSYFCARMTATSAYSSPEHA